MLREIISGLLIVLIIITGIFAYIILFDVKEIKSPSLTLNKKQYDIETEIDDKQFKKRLIKPFSASVKAQQAWLETHQEFDQEYKNILDELLNNQDLLFVEEYKDDIEHKREQLEHGFIDFKDKINKITNKEIEYYSSMIDYEMEQSLEKLRKKYDEEFAEYEEQVQQERRNELLNYRLKLETLDLSEQEAQKLREKIEDIESAKSIKINNKLNEIYYGLRLKTEKLSKEKERKKAELEKQFNKETERQIAQKKIELEKVLSLFQRNRYAALQNQMNEFAVELEQESEELLQKRDAIKEIVQNDLETLNKTYLDLTEERN